MRNPELNRNVNEERTSNRNRTIERELMRRHVERDRPRESWHDFTEAQPNPNLVGAVVGAGTAVLLGLDVIFNGGVGLQIAGGPIIAGSALIGALASKATSEYNAKITSSTHRAERMQAKNRGGN